MVIELAMQKILNWCRKHKILTTLIILGFLGAVGSNGQNHSSANSAKAAVTTVAQSPNATTAPPTTTSGNTGTSGSSGSSGSSGGSGSATTAVSPAIHAWATSFYNNYWSACYPDWNYVVNTEDAAGGPYGITTTAVIDNACGNLKAKSPDASINNLVDQMTSDELNWSIDVVNTTNGYYATDYQKLADDMTQINGIVTTDMNS